MFTQKAPHRNVSDENRSRIYDGMAQGKIDITTDALSDLFTSYLKKDPKPIEAIKKAFSEN